MKKDIMSIHEPKLKTHLNKQEISQLPVFQALSIDKIICVDNLRALNIARKELQHIDVVGFDTESQPTWQKGEISTGPHLIQIATENLAFLFPIQSINNMEIREFIFDIIESNEIKKVGFGIKQDKQQIYNTFHLTLNNCFDINTLFGELGYIRRIKKYPQLIGVQKSIAILFNQYYEKNVKITKSNWSKYPLSDKQKLYAGNDAYISKISYEKLILMKKELEINAQTEQT